MGKDEGQRRQSLCSELGGAGPLTFNLESPNLGCDAGEGGLRCTQQRTSKDQEVWRRNWWIRTWKPFRLYKGGRAHGFLRPPWSDELVNVPASDKAHVTEVPLSTPIKRKRPMIRRKSLGPDLLVQFISNGLVNESSSNLIDPISVELEANLSNSWKEWRRGSDSKESRNFWNPSTLGR